MAETKDIVASPLNGLILQNKTFGLADVGVLLEKFDAENGILGLVILELNLSDQFIIISLIC